MATYKTKNFTENDINNIINLYDFGYSMQQIKDVTNISIDIIKKYLVMKYDSKIPITEDEICYFKEAYKSGKDLTDISNVTGRTTSVIRNYVKDLISDREKLKEEKKIKDIMNHKLNMNDSDIINIYLSSEYTIYDIAKYYEVSDNIIRNIIKEWVYNKISYSNLFEVPITVAKIKIFRDFYCSKGDKYNINITTPSGEIKNVTITIDKLYPKVVTTDKDILFKAELVYRKI